MRVRAVAGFIAVLQDSHSLILEDDLVKRGIWEPQLRASLRLSLEPAADQPALRQGRAIGWITEALTPLRETHPHIDIQKVAIAIRSATGIETLIWLIDIAGYTRDQAAATVKATAQALLDAAVLGTPGSTGEPCHS